MPVRSPLSSGAASDEPMNATEGAIRAILDNLVTQRRRLEQDAAAQGLLDANRLAIAYWQQRLLRARADDAAA
jgi:hypothetical protein